MRRWNLEEDRKLLQLDARGYSVKELAQQLGRSVVSIYHRARFHRDMYCRWLDKTDKVFDDLLFSK